MVEFKVFDEWYWRRMQDQKEQEEQRIRQVFMRMDADGSGALDKKEVAALSEELGEKLSNAFSTKKLDEAFAEMDPVSCAVSSIAARERLCYAYDRIWLLTARFPYRTMMAR